MNLSRIAVPVFAVILAAVSCSAAQQQKSKVELLAEGDQYAEKLFDDQKALQSYQSAFAQAPNDYDILWRISRAYTDIGEHMPHQTDEDKQKQLKVYEQSLEFAQKAIAANPDGSMGYTYRAITNGRIALFRGVWASIDLVKQVKADCEKAIQLDPKNSLPYYILARAHTKVCEKPKMVRWPLGLGWASMDDALQNYEKAISLRPNFVMYHLDCAKAYIEEDEYEKAKQQLQSIPSIEKAHEDDEKYKKEAADLFEKIKDK